MQYLMSRMAVRRGERNPVADVDLLDPRIQQRIEERIK
jgi:hypothetical protein